MHVLPEALGVGGRVTGLVEAVVDAPAEVLHEGAEEAAVDGRDDEGGVEGQACCRHGCASDSWLEWIVERPGRYFRLPIESPPCQYFCSARKAMISGTTDTSEPMMMRLQSEWPPPLLFAASPSQSPIPTGIGNRLESDSMASGRK